MAPTRTSYNFYNKFYHKATIVVFWPQRVNHVPAFNHVLAFNHDPYQPWFSSMFLTTTLYGILILQYSNTLGRLSIICTTHVQLTQYSYKPYNCYVPTGW